MRHVFYDRLEYTPRLEVVQNILGALVDINEVVHAQYPSHLDDIQHTLRIESRGGCTYLVTLKEISVYSFRGVVGFVAFGQFRVILASSID